MNRPLKLVIFPLTCLFCLSQALPASAYKRTQTCAPSGFGACGPTELPKDLTWDTRTLPYHLNRQGSAGFPPPETSPLLPDLIKECFATWSSPACANFTTEYQGLTDQEAKSPFLMPDSGPQQNVVHFYDPWPYGNDQIVFALTLVSSLRTTGQIVDADILLNAQAYTYVDSTDPKEGEADLRNVLTHEIGHFLGFDHSEVAEATMFASVDPSDSKRRDLAQDDLEMLCIAYAPLNAPPEDAPPAVEDEGCCATSPTNRPAPLGLWVFGLLAGALFWRRTL